MKRERVGFCKVDGCGKKPDRRGWCTAHYMRWIRHGNPTAGVTPNGEPEQFYREKVLAYEGDDCLLWPYTRAAHGYAVLKRGKQRFIVSRLLCEDANGKPPSPAHQAAHGCGNGHLGCVTKRHLSWKTPAENSADTIIHGRSTKGEKNPQAKLKQQQVRTIRSLLKDGRTQLSIAAEFGVDPSTISYISTGRRWGWVSP